MLDWINLSIPPLLGGLVGFGVWYFQSRIDALRRAREQLHDDRRKLYADVLDPFIRVFTGLKNPKESDKAMKQIISYDYKRTAFEFNLIGSDDVVRAFNELMQYIYKLRDATGPESDPKTLMRYWGEFLLEIRKDIGDSDTTLTKYDMLRSQISDIDSILDEDNDK